MLRDHYDELGALDLSYWWFNVRYHYAWRQIRRITPAGPELLIDVGAGTCGFLSRVLAWSGLPPSRVLAIEGNEAACAVGRERGVPVVRADLAAVASLPLPRPPDVVTMLDVLEHVADPVEPLRDLRAIAGPGAHLLILVPALQGLWSRWDELLGHHRRYDRPTLRRELEAGGWHVCSMRYLFVPLVVPAYLRDRLMRSREISRTQFRRVSPLLNRILTAVFIAETYLPAPPFGTTLAAVARAG
jgi:SAM-dependent methyltransferase